MRLSSCEVDFLRVCPPVSEVVFLLDHDRILANCYFFGNKGMFHILILTHASYVSSNDILVIYIQFETIQTLFRDEQGKVSTYFQ